MKVDAVVLGGGDGAVIDPNCRFKGLVPLAGKPLVEWVVDAMREAEFIAEVVVVVPTAEDLGAWADLVDKLVVGRGGFMDNVIAGTSSFREDRPVLIATGDMPLLSGEAIDDFITRSFAADAKFSYPIISRADMDTQYPGSPRTYVRVDGTEVTGGNMMLADPLLVRRNAEVGQSLFGARKSPLAMARILGWRFVLKLAVGRLDVAELEATMARVLGGPTSAIRTPFASIGVDVDKAADVELTERILRETGRA